MQPPDSRAPVRLHYSVELRYDVLSAGADFIFNVQAARTRHQHVVQEKLEVSQQVLLQTHTDNATRARHLRLRAQAGPLSLRYQAVLDIAHHRADPATLAEVWIPDLPGDVLPYLYPSRYCQSDRLHRFAVAQFGGLWQGYSRVQAICDWVQGHVAFVSNSSGGTTTACDTLLDKQGVCRDFAHLMIAVCRALNIPARFTTGIDFGADPILGPPDFHAYVEAYLGNRWYMFDPSGTAIPMGFIRIGTGRDAADVSFATIFGSVGSQAPQIKIAALTQPNTGWLQPVHRTEALSTDGLA